jgi:hypothetical protein
MKLSTTQTHRLRQQAQWLIRSPDGQLDSPAGVFELLVAARLGLRVRGLRQVIFQ